MSAVFDVRSGQPREADQAARWLTGHRHVYVAERHTDPVSHAAQLDVLRRMHAVGRPIAIAVEWLPAQAQPTLDRYLAGELDEQAFQREVDWAGTWGHPFHHYAPILRFARAKAIPVWGVDAPHGLARQVGRVGVEGLSEAERAQLPGLDTGNDAHRTWFRELMSALMSQHGHGGHGPLDDAKLDRYYLAQLTRDELMSEHLAARLAGAPPDLTAVVLAGRGHVAFGHGVPLRASVLTGAGFAIVLPEASDQVTLPLEASPQDYPARPGDLVWVMSPPEPTRAAVTGTARVARAGDSAGSRPDRR